MSVEHVGRDKYDDYHKYICDVDGCQSSVEFNINNMPSDWQLIEVYEENVVVESRYLCPKHHIV